MREYPVLSGMMAEPKNLGRRISRRLSLVAKVPTFIQSKFRSDPEGDGAVHIRKWPQQFRKLRPVNIHIILPDGHERTITTTNRCTVKQLLQPVALELHICEYRLRMSDTLALVSLQAEITLLDGDTVILEDATRVRDERGELDSRFRLTEDLLESERDFLISLRTIFDVYARPLKKLCSITEDEQKQLFSGVEPILSVSNMLMNKLEDALASWDPHETRVGSLFSKQLWNQFEDYYHFFIQAKELLREKQYRDEEFVEICKLRQGAALHSIDSLLELPIQRLASYERYFQDLLCETNADHPDLDEVHKARDKAQELVKKCEEEINQLDRVQDLFPNDQLYLHDKDALTVKMKGLMRKRSTTAARLQRAFSSKSVRHSSSSSGTDMADVSVSSSAHSTPVKNVADKRQFIMETAVQFTNGLQSQERHLFLFNDLLLIAKARSGGNFKLKDKVRVSELWLATCIDDVAEVSKSRDTSFVVGWPTTNVVATFSSPLLRDLWWNKLGQVVQEERHKEPKSTTIQIAYHDAVQGIEYFKTLSVSSADTVRDCIKLVLSHLEMSNLDPNGFRLWVKSVSEESPYPLIGHEFPFAIKMNCLREYISNEEGFDLDHCNNIYSADPATRCQFILRSVQKPNYEINGNLLNGKTVNKTKGKKSPTKIQKVFRRVQSKPDSLEIVGTTPPSGAFFSQPLVKICNGDKLPRPLMEMLTELRSKGPHTVGIFRKSANARQVREIRERIDGGEDVDWGNVSAIVVAVVFKDFLRSLPDCLLGTALYDQWLQIATMECIEAALEKIKTLCDRLPSANVSLLRHFLCVLSHISNNCSQNMMSASNLAVCVGPSLLWANLHTNNVNPAAALCAEAAASKQVPALVTLLIDKCTVLFGADTLNLIDEIAVSDESKNPVCSFPQGNDRRISGKECRNKPPVYKHMARQGLLQHDSGNEESDSLHSLHHSDVMRRDDSSIDSLERELLGDPEAYDADHAIHLRRDKMSVTNLSRDSGLTLSDTQLYTPDEDIGSESSSSGRGSDRDKSRNSRRDAPRQRSSTNRTEQNRSNYVPVYSKSASRLNGYVQHNKVVSSYSSLSNYTPIYGQRSDVYRKLSDDVVYAVPKATPTVILGEEYQESSNFQRQDWFRRKSQTRKQTNGVKFESPPMGLRRSASDESLANVTPVIIAETQTKKPAHHRKGRAPPPPCDPCRLDSVELSRSKSDANLDVPDSATGASIQEKNHRSNVGTSSTSSSKLANGHAKSQSTPHIDEVDRSYDSSTLSDDDSTPHVSRSNSRGKDYGAVNSAWETTYGALTVPVPAPIHIIVSQDGSGSIVYQSKSSSKKNDSLHAKDGYENYHSDSVPRKGSKKTESSRNGERYADETSRSNKIETEDNGMASRKLDNRRQDDSSNGKTLERSRFASSTPRSNDSLIGSDRSKGQDALLNDSVERIYDKTNTRSREDRNLSKNSPYEGVSHSGSRYTEYDSIHSGYRSRDRSHYEEHTPTSSGSHHGTPDIPTYEEALIRRRLPTNWANWRDNSNLVQVRASPIRLNSRDAWDDGELSSGPGSIPPPLPPKVEVPPLPPKQRIHLRSNTSGSVVKMRHSNPAMRTRPVTIHMDSSILNHSDTPPSLPPKERSPNRRRGSNVSVVAIENNYTPLHRSFAFSTQTLRHAMENARKEDWSKEDSDISSRTCDQEIQTSGHWTQFCEIETQTSLSPQPSVSSDDAKPDFAISRYEVDSCRGERSRKDRNCRVDVTSSRNDSRKITTRSDNSTHRAEVDEHKYSNSDSGSEMSGAKSGKLRSEKIGETNQEMGMETERRGRDRKRDNPILHRSHSLPARDKTVSDESDSETTDSDSEEETTTGSTATSQSIRRSEISWSVSQLRAIFAGNSSSSIPPPYRPPPAHRCLNNRQRSDSTESYGEESYV